jgi:hypothetical protein
MMKTLDSIRKGLSPARRIGGDDIDSKPTRRMSKAGQPNGH